MSETNEVNARFERIEERQREQGERLTRVSTVVEEQLASKIWVKELVEPIVQNTTEVRHLVQENIRESRAQAQAQERAIRETQAKHDNLLEERAQRERIEFEEKQKRAQAESEAKIKALEAQTWSAILKEKGLPLLSALVALSVLAATVANYIAGQLQHLPK